MTTKDVSPGRPLDLHKRRAILEAAQTVFTRDGYAAASMDEVARAAGVGKMTVYRHFGSKDALFDGMLREVCTGVFPGEPLPEGADLATELRDLGWKFVDLVTDPKRLSTYRLAMAEAERMPEFARLFHDGAVAPVLNHVAGRIAAHVPALTEVEAKRLAGMYLQMVQGPAMLRLLLGVPPQPWNDDFGTQIDLAVGFVAGQVKDPAAV